MVDWACKKSSFCVFFKANQYSRLLFFRKMTISLIFRFFVLGIIVLSLIF